MPYYTKVKVFNKIGFIVWSDEETSEEDLSDLNYFIKFGDDLETIQQDDNCWYDETYLHYDVIPV